MALLLCSFICSKDPSRIYLQNISQLKFYLRILFFGPLAERILHDDGASGKKIEISFVKQFLQNKALLLQVQVKIRSFEADAQHASDCIETILIYVQNRRWPMGVEGAITILRVAYVARLVHGSLGWGTIILAYYKIYHILNQKIEYFEYKN